jgi:hypothetical protein
VLPKRIVWTLFLTPLLAFPAMNQTQNPRPRPNVPTVEEDEARERMAKDLAKKANQERQATLKSDTDKLLKLAVELKQSVDKSSENVLSMEVIKKADEIEKLAHSVKEKMKGPN